MNNKIYSNAICACENSLFDELSSLESVLKLTKDSCLKQEFNSNYYDLVDINKVKLSEERNHYLNLLTIAIEKVNLLKQINRNLENEICLLK